MEHVNSFTCLDGVYLKSTKKALGLSRVLWKLKHISRINMTLCQFGSPVHSDSRLFPSGQAGSGAGGGGTFFFDLMK